MMKQDDTTFPLSVPSWTWGEAVATMPEPVGETAHETEHHPHKIAMCWNELPSRRWLVQASRRV
ncbi:MAG: hypothetical protein GY794_13485 [bacterium]|nr:hypothetical protein [bacterium]